MPSKNHRSMSRPGMPMCLLPAVLALAIFDVGAQSYLPASGGPGGLPFQAPCPGTQVLTGVRLFAGNDVDAIQPMCGIAYGPEKVAIQPGVPPVFVGAGTSGAQRMDWREESEDWHGGTGGVLHELRCPARTPVVLSMMIIAEGQKTVVVNSIGLFCGKVSDAPQAVPQYPTALFEAPATGGRRHAQSSTLGCPSGQVAIGLHGRQETWVHALGLVCGEPTMTIERMGSPRKPPRFGSAPADLATEAVARPAIQDTIPSMGRNKPDTAKTGSADSALQTTRIPDPPICAKARSARERKSPAADRLVKQCREQGGIP